MACTYSLRYPDGTHEACTFPDGHKSPHSWAAAAAPAPEPPQIVGGPGTDPKFLRDVALWMANGKHPFEASTIARLGDIADYLDALGSPKLTVEQRALRALEERIEMMLESLDQWRAGKLPVAPENVVSDGQLRLIADYLLVCKTKAAGMHNLLGGGLSALGSLVAQQVAQHPEPKKPRGRHG